MKDGSILSIQKKILENQWHHQTSFKLTQICPLLKSVTPDSGCASNLVFTSIVYFRGRMGKDHLGSDQRKVKEKDEEEKEFKVLDEKDIALLKSYGQGQYTKALKVMI